MPNELLPQDREVLNRAKRIRDTMINENWFRLLTADTPIMLVRKEGLKDQEIQCEENHIAISTFKEATNILLKQTVVLARQIENQRCLKEIDKEIDAWWVQELNESKKYAAKDALEAAKRRIVNEV